jgi:hypothetical protein
VIIYGLLHGTHGTSYVQAGGQCHFLLMEISRKYQDEPRDDVHDHGICGVKDFELRSDDSHEYNL